MSRNHSDSLLHLQWWHSGQHHCSIASTEVLSSTSICQHVAFNQITTVYYNPVLHEHRMQSTCLERTRRTSLMPLNLIHVTRTQSAACVCPLCACCGGHAHPCHAPYPCHIITPHWQRCVLHNAQELSIGIISKELGTTSSLATRIGKGIQAQAW